jgi:hypothetical protein
MLAREGRVRTSAAGPPFSSWPNASREVAVSSRVRRGGEEVRTPVAITARAQQPHKANVSGGNPHAMNFSALARRAIEL